MRPSDASSLSRRQKPACNAFFSTRRSRSLRYFPATVHFTMTSALPAAPPNRTGDGSLQKAHYSSVTTIPFIQERSVLCIRNQNAKTENTDDNNGSFGSAPAGSRRKSSNRKKVLRKIIVLVTGFSKETARFRLSDNASEVLLLNSI